MSFGSTHRSLSGKLLFSRQNDFIITMLSPQGNEQYGILQVTYIVVHLTLPEY